jgi:hypothetical protein
LIVEECGRLVYGSQLIAPAPSVEFANPLAGLDKGKASRRSPLVEAIA